MPAVTSPLAGETLLTLRQIAKLRPAHRGEKKSLNVTTVLRWVIHGARALTGVRVKLEAIRSGDRWLSSREALDRFEAALTGAVATETRPVRRSAGTGAARKGYQAAMKELEEMLGPLELKPLSTPEGVDP